MHCLDWKWTKLECLSVWQRIRCAVPSPTQKAALSVNTHSVDATQRNNIRESKTMRGMKHKSLPDTKGICFVFSLLPLFLLLVRLTSRQLLYHCVLNCHYLCTLSIDPDGGGGGGAALLTYWPTGSSEKDSKSFQTIDSTRCILYLCLFQEKLQF